MVILLNAGAKVRFFSFVAKYLQQIFSCKSYI